MHSPTADSPAVGVCKLFAFPNPYTKLREVLLSCNYLIHVNDDGSSDDEAYSCLCCFLAQILGGMNVLAYEESESRHYAAAFCTTLAAK